ncbi:hypothetical protein J6590_010352 [Homalodisca vitripennis]|nr:hypothetical protein J6590_010352 [Homalodisca vitripennis]
MCATTVREKTVSMNVKDSLWNICRTLYDLLSAPDGGYGHINASSLPAMASDPMQRGSQVTGASREHFTGSGLCGSFRKVLDARKSNNNLVPLGNSAEVTISDSIIE